jgi:hypothetical protein
MKYIALAFIAGLTAVMNGQTLHPGLTAQRDWSKTVHRFNLHKHMTNPTAKDRRAGVENSRRLARNAIKLGIDNNTHRQVSFCMYQFHNDTVDLNISTINDNRICKACCSKSTKWNHPGV